MLIYPLQDFVIANDLKAFLIRMLHKGRYYELCLGKANKENVILNQHFSDRD